MKEICGVKYTEGVAKKSNKPYQAYIVYYTEDGHPRGVDGFVTGEAFINVNLLMGVVPQVGDKFDIYYDARGFIAAVKFGK